MNDLYLTDEDIHGCEEEAEITVLREKLERANRRIAELEKAIKEIIEISNEVEI